MSHSESERHTVVVNNFDLESESKLSTCTWYMRVGVGEGLSISISYYKKLQPPPSNRPKAAPSSALGDSKCE